MRHLLFGAAAAALLAITPAQAADLGGNCCADLDERVAELEATVARKGNRKVSLQVYGQVNAAILWHNRDDVLDKTTKIIDNSVSQTRFGFQGTASISKEWSAGYRIEIGVDPAGGDLAVRHSYVWLRNASLGTFSIGQQSTATDGIIEIDLSNSSVASLQGTLLPFDSFIEDQTGLGVVNPFDGPRAQAIKWISPSIAGFSVTAAWRDDDTYDVALKYAGELGAFRVAGGVGYREDGIRQFTGGSGMIMHIPSGVFLGGFYGKSDGIQQAKFLGVTFPIGDAKVDAYGGRLGIEAKSIAAGKTTLFVEYGELKIAGTDWKPIYYGAGIVQHIDAAAMDLYLSVKQYQLDIGSGIDDDVTVVVAGSRIKF